MKRVGAVLALASGLLIIIAGVHAQGSPRLIVMLVIDQMRADYLQTFDRHWHGGFRTLLSEGRVFDNARYPYLNTLTCAGHSTIGTGALPHTHGMVANTWLDRGSRRLVGCTNDPDATDISYGRPAPIGNSGKRILVPTLADELRAQKAGARVVSLSLKARSAIGLAGHGGDAVVWFDDESGSFATSRAYASAAVPAVRSFIEAHPYERENGTSWMLSGPADSYVMRDAGVGERPPATWSGLFPHRLAGRNGADALFYQLWQASPRSDAYLENLAESLIDSLALGQRDSTDFLGISFSALDEVGHSFGPDSREIEDVLMQLDVALQRLIAHLDARVGRANYMLALSADHGVAPIAIAPLGGRIANDDVRERIDETLTTAFGVRDQGSYVDAANFTDVYLAPGVFDRLRASHTAMAALERSLKALPGIERVLRPDQLSDKSSDVAIRSAALSYRADRSGDLILVPKKYWYFGGRAGGGTTHGTLHEYDQHVPFIIFGGTTRHGHNRTAVTPADIAPTLARFAGVRLPKAEGKAVPQ
jgi:predicted AlkP superfamily pyrophosphatase or phosphodiesterase